MREPCAEQRLRRIHRQRRELNRRSSSSNAGGMASALSKRSSAAAGSMRGPYAANRSSGSASPKYADARQERGAVGRLREKRELQRLNGGLRGKVDREPRQLVRLGRALVPDRAVKNSRRQRGNEGCMNGAFQNAPLACPFAR